MQLVEAAGRQMVLLELDPELIRQGAKETGFECKATDHGRCLSLELTAPEREGPLLLFDAASPANTNWFLRCQFYVDGRTGTVLQTPFTVTNQTDPGGRVRTRALRLSIQKELPAHFKLPGRQAVSERVLYSVLFNLLNAFQNVGVGICGQGPIKPLAGKVESAK